jgi:hypothetical protein
MGKKPVDTGKCIDELKNATDPAVREAAARALGNARDEESFTALLDALGDSHLPLRRTVAQALAIRGDLRAVQPLILAFRRAMEQDIWHKEAGSYALALAGLGDTQAIPVLGEGLASDKPWHRAPIQKALFQFGDASVPILSSMLNHPDTRVRKGVAEFLKEKEKRKRESEEMMRSSTKEWNAKISATRTGPPPWSGTRGPDLFSRRPPISPPPMAVKKSEYEMHMKAPEEQRRRFEEMAAASKKAVYLRGICVERFYVKGGGGGGFIHERTMEMPARKLGEKAETDRMVKASAPPSPEQPYSRMVFFREEAVDTSARGPGERAEADTTVKAAPPPPAEPGVMEASAREPLEMAEVSTMVKAAPPPPAEPGARDISARDLGERAETDKIGEAQPPRYTIPQIFHDHLRGLGKLGEGEPLVKGEWYCLQVTISTSPEGGLPSRDSGRRPIREPRQDRPVTIVVTAEGEGFKIEEPTRSFMLPPSGDAPKPAWFRIQPLEETTDPKALPWIRMHLYGGFFLLAILTLKAEVVARSPDKPPTSRFGSRQPIWISEEQIAEQHPDYASIIPRAMNIRVQKKKDAFDLRFTFNNTDKGKVELTAPCRLKHEDLEGLLNDVRTVWEGIATSKTFTKQLDGDVHEFPKCLGKLATLGRRAWLKLFDVDAESSLFVVGKMLEEHRLAEDSIIQISFEDKESNEFVFPWALLYDQPLEGGKDIDPRNFWGIRYSIEQRVYGMHNAGDKREGKADLGFMMWNKFRNTGEHEQLLKTLGNRSSGRVGVTGPILVADDICLSCWKDWDILYFYAHGNTRERRTGVGAGHALESFLRFYKKLEEGDPEDPRLKLFADVYNAAKGDQYEPDRDWIELTRGKFYLDSLYDMLERNSLTPRKPIVFLNMCESAQVVPTLSDSFISFFLNRGASCVLGTECPMTIEFAHPFAERFFECLLAGDPVGIAVLKARRYFMDNKKNPLGLAYTLYGSATLFFGTGIAGEAGKGSTGS